MPFRATVVTGGASCMGRAACFRQGIAGKVRDLLVLPVFAAFVFNRAGPCGREDAQTRQEVLSRVAWGTPHPGSRRHTRVIFQVLSGTAWRSAHDPDAA